MRVTPSELRVLRQGGILIRFALLDSMTFTIAEVPAAGSAGTSIEQPCRKPHWGFVIDGEVSFATEDRQRTIPPGGAFHVPGGGPPHRFHAPGAARIAGFEPIDLAAHPSDSGLAGQGFDVLGQEPSGAMLIPPVAARPLEVGQIEARTWTMSSFVLNQARFGPGSGYTTNWCDAPHWGMVTAGQVAIEWEDDIEMLSAGDIYHCPAGPPGHRLEAADPASVLDLTPITALAGGTRVALWRPRPSDSAQPSGLEPIAIAPLS